MNRQHFALNSLLSATNGSALLAGKAEERDARGRRSLVCDHSAAPLLILKLALCGTRLVKRRVEVGLLGIMSLPETRPTPSSAATKRR